MHHAHVMMYDTAIELITELTPRLDNRGATGRAVYSFQSMVSRLYAPMEPAPTGIYL